MKLKSLEKKKSIFPQKMVTDATSAKQEGINKTRIAAEKSAGLANLVKKGKSKEYAMAKALTGDLPSTGMLSADKAAQEKWYEEFKKKQKRSPQGMESGSSDTSSPTDKSNVKIKVGGRIIGGK